MTTEKQTKGAPVSRMTLADLNKRNQQTYDASYAEEVPRGLDPKAEQLKPGMTVHNSQGKTGQVVRVEGSRVLVRCPDGGQEQFDLRRTFPYSGDSQLAGPDGNEPAPAQMTAEPGEPSATTPAQEDSEGTEALREGIEEFTAEENQEPEHAAGGAEALREGAEKFLGEEEDEPEHQADGLVPFGPNTSKFARQTLPPLRQATPATKVAERIKEKESKSSDEIVRRPWSKEDERLYWEQVHPEPNTDRYQEQRARLYMSQHPGTSLEEALHIVNQR